jgi:L-aspartate oxidase
VYAERAATSLLSDRSIMEEPMPMAEPWDEQHTEVLHDSVIIDHDWDEARRVMWDFVGIVRNDHRLEIGLQRILQLKDTVESLYWKCRLDQDLLELRNVVLVGELVIRSAQRRKESRGLHFTESYTERDDEFRHDTVLQIDEE